MRVTPFRIQERNSKVASVEGAASIGPLSTLRDDQNCSKGFNFVLEKILSGRIRETKQIEAFINPRFDYIPFVSKPGKVLMAGPSGNVAFLDQEEQYVSKSVLEDARISKEQAELLKKILDDNNLAVLKRNETKGFNFVLEKILSGRIRETKQIAAFINPRFEYSTFGSKPGKVLMAGPSDNVVFLDQEEQYVSKSVLEDARISKEQAELLKKILDDNNLAVLKRNETKGFNFVLEKILSGRIRETKQIAAFINPRFEYSTFGSKPGKVLMASPSSYVAFLDQADQYVSKSVLKDARISKEQAKVLSYLVTPDIKIPGELVSAAFAYSSTGENAIFSGEQANQYDEKSREFFNCAKKTGLQRKVFEKMFNGINADALCSMLGQFNKNSDIDIEIAKEILTDVITFRIRDSISKAFKYLNSSPRDYDKALEEARGLLRSKDEGEKQAGLKLTRMIYNQEVSEIKVEVFKKILAGKSEKEIDQFLNEVAIRPSIEGFDYLEAILDFRNQVLPSLINQRNITVATNMREKFATSSVAEMTKQIDSFSGNLASTLTVRKQLTALYRTVLAASKPGVFDDKVAPILEANRKDLIKDSFIQAKLGRNKQAARYVLSNFFSYIYPLVETLKADPATKKEMTEFLGKDSVIKFTQNLITLEKQRKLTENEKEYIRSVEYLSKVNPYLVACAKANPSLTIEYLRHHFEKISANTLANLKDGDYIPAIGVGFGPNGIDAMGEIVRNNPALAESTLLIDEGEQPGGPFAIPEGPAWNLNSANRRGKNGVTMPKTPGENELETVRAYGSPVTRWYPGERLNKKDLRGGSINTTVDWLLTPDDISNTRYPTNEQLALIISLQAAVVVKKLALKTKLIAIEKNPNLDSDGDKIVTLEVPNTNGTTRRIRLRTDALFITSGLGEANFGFPLEGKRAQKVIEDSKTMELPKVSVTLNAFRALASREVRTKNFEKTMVIYGGGNSAETLLEYVGNLFVGDNPYVRNIEKVYIITEKDLSNRPRYAQINDIKEREGRSNFIEQVKDRVADLDYENNIGDPANRKLNFYNKEGRIITDNEGQPVKADFAVAATGFKSQLDKLLRNYVKELGADVSDIRSPLTLPTNPGVAVAETLKVDPNVLILGTASAPRFTDLDKLAQLPREAREALLRNGAENAVAIGFRGPDTQAAMNIWINSRDIKLPVAPRSKKKIIPLTNKNGVKRNDAVEIDMVNKHKESTMPRNITDERPLLSPIFNYNLNSASAVEVSQGKGFTGRLDFHLELDPSKQKFKLISDNDLELSNGFVGEIKRACEDPSFQRYARISLERMRRVNSNLEIVLTYQNGKLSPGLSYVEG